MKEINRAYVAGILDGEGHFQINAPTPKRRTFDPLVVVWNTSRTLLDFLKSTSGGNIFPSKNSNPKARTGWRWVITSGEIRAVLPELVPYLKVKKEQAQLVLKLAQLNAGRDATHKRRRPLEESELKERYILSDTLKQLNKVGPIIPHQLQLNK